MDNRLAKVDLNLLVAFRTLMEERSVTRAAERLFVTQPAMSKTLQRLRDLFNDDLFSRSAEGLVPSPRAEELHTPVLDALAQLETALFDQEFDPTTARAEIRICLPEASALHSMPELVKSFQQKAPGISLYSRNILDDHLELLASGGLDFSIYINQGFGAEFETTTLTTFRPAIWLRRKHPLAQAESLSVKDLIDYPHVLLHLPNITDKDVMNLRKPMEEGGLAIEPAFETTQLLPALEVLHNSDAIMLGPPHLAKYQLTQRHIVSKPIRDVPVLDELLVEMCLIQHKRSCGSALHGWVKQQIVEIFDQQPG